MYQKNTLEYVNFTIEYKNSLKKFYIPKNLQKIKSDILK